MENSESPTRYHVTINIFVDRKLIRRGKPARALASLLVRPAQRRAVAALMPGPAPTGPLPLVTLARSFQHGRAVHGKLRGLCHQAVQQACRLGGGRLQDHPHHLRLERGQDALEVRVQGDQHRVRGNQEPLGQTARGRTHPGAVPLLHQELENLPEREVIAPALHLAQCAQAAVMLRPCRLAQRRGVWIARIGRLRRPCPQQVLEAAEEERVGDIHDGCPTAAVQSLELELSRRGP